MDKEIITKIGNTEVKHTESRIILNAKKKITFEKANA